MTHDDHDHAHDDHGHGHGHGHEHAEGGHGHGHGLGHVVPFKILAGVGATLLVMTLLTVWAARQDFGQLNLVIALLIATFKAGLVALFFMHLRWDRPFHAVIVVSGIFAAMLFVGIAFMDGDQYQRDICAKAGPDCKIWHDQVKAYRDVAETRPSAGGASTPTPTPTPAPTPPPPAPPTPTPAPPAPPTPAPTTP